MLRLDLVFAPDRHMVMEYAVRVRDVRRKMINDLFFDAPPEELQYPQDFTSENGFYAVSPTAAPPP
jgi:hypothetical protein